MTISVTGPMGGGGGGVTAHSGLTELDYASAGHSGFTPAFTPADLLGLHLWLRADLGVTLDGSGNVSLWEDQSPDGNDFAQSEAANRPGYNATGANGYPTLTFWRPDSLWLKNSTMTAWGGSTKVTSIFAVVNTSEQDRNQTVLYGSLDSLAQGWNALSFAANNYWYSSWRDSNAASHQRMARAQFATPNVFLLFSVIMDAKGERLEFRMNGKSVSVNNDWYLGVDLTCIYASIGMASENNFGWIDRPFSGKIPEIILCKRALNSGEVMATEKYLMDRYAIKDYEPDHVYSPPEFRSAVTVWGPYNSPYLIQNYDDALMANANDGALAVVLPNARYYGGFYRRLTVIRTDAAVANAVTITDEAGYTIGGVTSYVLHIGRGITVQSDGSNWQIISEFGVGLVSVADDYTVKLYDQTILVNATGEECTIDLPAAASCPGKVLNIKKTDASANNVVLDGNALEEIDGETTYTLDTQYQSVTIQSDGANWHIL